MAGLVFPLPNKLYIFRQVAENETMAAGKSLRPILFPFKLAPAVDAGGENCWRSGKTSNDGYLFPFCVTPYLCECLSMFRICCSWGVFFSAATVVLLDS